MLAIVMRGLPGSGKSTLARAISSRLRIPLIDKDDIRDVLDDPLPDGGRLAYDVWLRLIERQLKQGLSVVCDSPLPFESLYKHVEAMADATSARAVLIHCECADEDEHRRRIESRKQADLPKHHMISWERLLEYRRRYTETVMYPISVPMLVVSTLDDLSAVTEQAVHWLSCIDISNTSDGHLGDP